MEDEMKTNTMNAAKFENRMEFAELVDDKVEKNILAQSEPVRVEKIDHDLELVEDYEDYEDYEEEWLSADGEANNVMWILQHRLDRETLAVIRVHLMLLKKLARQEALQEAQEKVLELI